jgi:hypothetical protein
LDDIEHFLEKMRASSDAYRELERRKDKNRKRRKREEQILAEHAAGPLEKEFIETYQKLKYAINLIVR